MRRRAVTVDPVAPETVMFSTCRAIAASLAVGRCPTMRTTAAMVADEAGASAWSMRRMTLTIADV